MADASKWIHRGKSIAQLIRELQSFEDHSLEVRISVDDGETDFPVSLVGKQRGTCLVVFAGARAPADAA